MSLLMEALKNAEKRKLGGQEPPEPELAPEPAEELDLILEEEAVAEELAPEYQLELEPEISVEPPQAEPEPPPPPEPPEPPPPAPEPEPAIATYLPAQRRQANNVFTAKQPAPPARRWLFWAGATIALIVTGAGQGYRVWQEQHPPAISILPPAPPVAEPAALPELTSPSPPEPEPVQNEKPEFVAEKPAPPAPTPLAVKNPPPPPTPPAAPPAAPAVAPAAPSPAPVPGSGIAISRSTQPDPLNEQLNLAYAAFIQGDLREAGQKYQAMLELDPRNRDALLGLAAIASKKGLPEESLRLYTQLLELDPNDALAQAGVLAGGAASPQNEGRIKSLLARQPDSDFLYFVLGNLYSAQSRWPEAEQAFFQACQRNGGNPDYAFNLAVSLEHLRQLQPARDNYRKALALAVRRPAAFDQVLAWKRLQSLSVEERP